MAISLDLLRSIRDPELVLVFRDCPQEAAYPPWMDGLRGPLSRNAGLFVRMPPSSVHSWSRC